MVSRTAHPSIVEVASMTDARATYMVNLEKRTCTCPHYTHRLIGTGRVCKHVEAAERSLRAQEFEARLFIAKGEPTVNLERLLAKHEEKRNLEVAFAIRCELHDRAEAARRDAELKAVFA